MAKGHNNWDFTESLFLVSSHCILLWLKATIIEILQRGYLWPLVITNYYGERIFWPLVTTVYYAQKPEQLRCHREAICGLWLLQFIMAKVQNHWGMTEGLFVSTGSYNSLWPKATIFEISLRGYLWPLVPTIHYGQRLFVAAGRYSLLCPNATTIEMLQIYYLQPLVATDH